MSIKNVLVCPRSGKSRGSIDPRRRLEQGLTTPRTQGGQGTDPAPQDTLSGIKEFYGLPATKGGEGSVALPPQSGSPARSPVILTDTVNLDGLTRLPFHEPLTCVPKYIVLQCACGRQIVPSTCMSRDCLVCRDHVGKKRSESVFRRLLRSTQYQSSHNSSKTVIYTIFTLPVSHRQRYLDPKAWTKLRRKTWQMLKAHFGALYGMEASHPHGDKTPSAFHPHMNFLWVQRNGHHPFIPSAKLRGLFAQLVGTETVDVYTQYSGHVRRIKHWCNYTCRTFPGNHAWTGPIRWYGQYPKDNTHVDTTCPECGCKYKRIGSIDKAVVDEYYKTGFMLGLDPPWYDDDKIKW